MAIGAANRLGELLAQLGERHFIEFCHAHLFPQFGVVGRFAGITGGMRCFGNPPGGIDIFQGIGMAAVIVVILAKWISREQNHLARVSFEP